MPVSVYLYVDSSSAVPTNCQLSKCTWRERTVSPRARDASSQQRVMDILTNGQLFSTVSVATKVLQFQYENARIPCRRDLPYSFLSRPNGMGSQQRVSSWWLEGERWSGRRADSKLNLPFTEQVFSQLIIELPPVWMVASVFLVVMVARLSLGIEFQVFFYYSNAPRASYLTAINFNYQRKNNEKG